jgi:hypothetical protein
MHQSLSSISADGWSATAASHPPTVGQQMRACWKVEGLQPRLAQGLKAVEDDAAASQTRATSPVAGLEGGQQSGGKAW